MAIVAADIVIPPHFITGSGPAMSSFSLDASGERFALIFQAPKSGNLRKVWIRTGAVTAATDTDVRVETVGADGHPTDTLWGTNTNATIAAAALTASTIIEVTLTADAALSRGDLFAVVIAPTGTPNYVVNPSLSYASFRFPYGDSFVASWTFAPLLAAMTLEYSDGSHAVIPATLPTIDSFDSSAFSNATTPDEKALRFSLPMGVRLHGAWLWIDPDGNFDLVLYDAAGNTVATKSWDDILMFNTASGGTPLWVMFDADVDLDADTVYRLAVKPTSGSTVVLYGASVGSGLGAHWDQTPGGAAFHYSERTDSGSWTDTPEKRPFMGLLLSGFDPAP